MMRDMEQSSRDQVRPGVDKLPDSCQKEVRSYCKGAPSQLHCLGKHASDISEGCRADIGKSVPFVCSDAIDRWCDIITGGILPCLAAKLPELDPPCKDSVVLTRKVVAKVNARKATGTGSKGSAKNSQRPKDREAALDAKLQNLWPAPGPA